MPFLATDWGIWQFVLCVYFKRGATISNRARPQVADRGSSCRYTGQARITNKCPRTNWRWVYQGVVG